MALRNIDNVPFASTKEVVERALVVLCRLVNEPTKTVDAVTCSIAWWIGGVLFKFTNRIAGFQNGAVVSQSLAVFSLK